jgi:hypothetical protein
LQSPNPELQVPGAQTPPEQVAVAFGTEQGSHAAAAHPVAGESSAAQDCPHIFCCAVHPVPAPPVPDEPPVPDAPPVLAASPVPASIVAPPVEAPPEPEPTPPDAGAPPA